MKLSNVFLALGLAALATPAFAQTALDSSVSGTVNSRHAHNSEGSDSIIRESQCGIAHSCKNKKDRSTLDRSF